MNLVKNTLTCHISQSVITVIHSQETTDLTEANSYFIPHPGQPPTNTCSLSPDAPR